MEAVLFVPSWKALAADDFFMFYQKYGKKISLFFTPLTIAATVVPLISVAYSFMCQVENQIMFGLMGIFTLAFFSTFFLYFKKANKSFKNKSLSSKELSLELKKWECWHWTRIFFEFIAFECSLLLMLK